MRKNASRNAVIRRHLRLRKKISGTAACPRLNVFRSLANIYAQIINDETGETLVSASTVEKANKASGKQLVLSQETLPIQGGFILRSGNVEVNCTFDTLVRLQKAETAGAVAKKLFPEA